MNVPQVALAEVAAASAGELLQVQELLENEDSSHDEGGWNEHDDLLQLGGNHIFRLDYVESTVNSSVGAKVPVIQEDVLDVYHSPEDHKDGDEGNGMQLIPQQEQYHQGRNC